MVGLVLRGLATRKLRSALTAIAILLGVTMISGTLVLTDQIDRAFVQIFEGLGVPFAPHLLNFVVLTAAVSAIRS